MDPEAAKSVDHRKELSWKSTVLLAFQSLGVAYGDLSISPLYVYKTTFAEDIRHSRTNIEIYGVLSFVFWTLTLVPLFKYAFIVLRADDNGEGGTFALYSLICRHANVSLLPNKQLADEELSTYIIEPPPDRGTNSRIKIWLEKHKKLHVVLLIVVMLGTGMVIGDGVLTPTLSVFSAVSGLELLMSSHQHEYTVVPVTCFILICLFALQHYGTHRVSFLFAPIILTWLICISGLGIYNIARWNPGIIQALSPYYMYKFLKKTKKSGWMSLGGILLCITGSEAMFADLGHFSYSSMQIAFTFVVYPALILAYMGQAAYLSKHHMIDPDYKIGFYVYVPEVVRWPVFLLAVVAAIVGSQAIISCTFSIINQSHALGCFPRVKVIHTSDKISGQIYIPEINWMLMILCVAVAVGFRNLKHVGNAQGLALMTVMLVTTWLTSVVVVVCWKRPPLLALSFLVFFSAIEGFYFSACLTKFLGGAWLPVLLAVLLMTVMFVWHYATSKKYEHDVHNKVSLEWLLALGENIGAARVPGIGLVYTDLISGIPSSFSRFITNLPAYHRILVFVCIKYIPVPFVPPAERYLVGRVGPIKHRSYRCIVRYGYRDVHQDVNSFEDELTASLADFIRMDAASGGFGGEGEDEVDGGLAVIGSSFCAEEADEGSHTGSVSLELAEAMPPKKARKVRFLIEEGSSSSTSSRPTMADEAREELEDLQEACEAGTAFILGHSYVKTKPGSPVLKKLVLDIGYNFLKRNCRGPEVALRVPPASLLEVGMVYVL